MLVFELTPLEILVEREVPAGIILGGGGGGGGTGAGGGTVAGAPGVAGEGCAGAAPVADWPGGGAGCSDGGAGLLHAVRNIERENAIPRVSATRGL